MWQTYLEVNRLNNQLWSKSGQTKGVKMQIFGFFPANLDYVIDGLNWEINW